MILRSARPADAAAVAAVYLRARHGLDFAPPLHTDAEICAWIAKQLLPAGGTWVIEDCGAIVAMASGTPATAEQPGWIAQMYVDPPQQRRGHGRRLLAHLAATLGRPLRLYCFAANTAARRFYEAQGFHAIAYGDGSGNEERCPDVLYELPR